MPSFRTLRRAGIAVSSGSIVALGTITIEVGGTTEVVTVVAETPLVQTASGERSFTVTTESVANLPLAGRTFEQLLSLAPGVVVTPGELNPATRAGGGGGANYMLDGATAMDPGINRPATRISVESLAEVQARDLDLPGGIRPLGRPADQRRDQERHQPVPRIGLRGACATRSGTRTARPTSSTATRSRIVDQMDYGFSVGGPVGRPGGQNKLFFYFNLEANPRSVRRRRESLPRADGARAAGRLLAVARQSRQPRIPTSRIRSIAGTCSAADTRACFQDGGVLGRIPANRLYRERPEHPEVVAGAEHRVSRAGQAYNYESVDPEVEHPRLSAGHPRRLPAHAERSAAASSSSSTSSRAKCIRARFPASTTRRSTTTASGCRRARSTGRSSPTMFLEASFGANFHHQEGCSITGGEPNYCRTGLSVTSAGNRNLSGFGNIPYLFPNATVLDPNTFTYWVLNQVDTTMWDGTRILAPPQFAWGTRVANPPHPNVGPFGANPGVTGGTNFILDTRNRTWNASLTKVAGQHTLQDGLLLLPQPAAARRRQRHRQHQLRQRREQPARHDVRVLPTPRSASSAPTRRRRAGPKAPTSRSITRRSSRTTGA